MTTRQEGDVQARVVVRALELLESIRLVCTALRTIPPGPLRAFEGVPKIPPGEGFAVTVVEDAVRGVEVNPGDSARALQDMREAGAQVASSDEVLASAGTA